jgi:IS4 transposase
VFVTNRGSGHITEHGYRWEIERGYRSIEWFVAAPTSKDFGLRFFYSAFACLLYSIVRAVDLLGQVELMGDYGKRGS